MAGRTQAPGESPLRFRLKPFFVREVELLIARPLQLIWHTKAIVLPLARRPLIVMAALKLRQEHFVIDGETVALGPDGVSDFAALHSGTDNERAQLYAFDMLAGDGEDQRQLPLSLRKTDLARLLRCRIPGIFIAEYEQGEIGRDLFPRRL